MQNTEAQKEKSRAAKVSITSAIILTVIKLIIGILTNSLAILSLSIDSFLDTAGSVTSYISIKISGKPPDPEHQYGHGKIENLGSLTVAIIIFISIIFIFNESINRLIFSTDSVIPGVIGFVGLLTSIFLDIGVSTYLKRVSEKHNSQVLEANSLQFKMDIWTQCIVIVGLIFVSIGFKVADTIIALSVSVYILYLGIVVGKKAIDSLLDKAPRDIFEKIDRIVKDSEDIVKYRNLRVRTAGSKTFVDVSIFVPRILSLEKAHNIASSLEEKIKEENQDTDIVVHIEGEENNENVGDKIRIIAGRIIGIKGVHDLWVRKIDNNYEIDAHIEVNPDIVLSEAHKAVTILEKMMQKEFGEDSKITLHIDTDVDRVIYTEKIEKTVQIMENDLRKRILNMSEVKSCDKISSKRFGDKFHVSISCKLEKDLRVDEAHKISEKIENEVTRRFKKVSKVFVHTEPPQ